MKAYIESMGCDSNVADANQITKYLKANNVDIVSDPKEADYIFLMSCGFNNIILNNNIKRLRELRKFNAKLILGGCIPKIKKEITKEVDFFFYPKEINKLDDFFSFKLSLNSFSPSFKREDKKIIRIATGCEGNCSYCAIKIANGKTTSRSISDISQDIREGLAEGFNKFLFTSEDNGSWGQDIGLSIIDLIKEINNINGNFKISLTTFNPQWFIRYPEMYDILRTDKIEKKIYFPLQSGSDRILKLMNRRYTVKDYLYIFNKLKKEIPEIKIQTDVLIGFPSETEEDFKKTLDLIEKLDIFFLQVFVYTDMKNTPSLKLKPKILSQIAKDRANKIISRFLDKNKNEKRKLVNTNLNNHR